MSPVPTYILRTMVVGAFLGTGHGVARGWKELKRDVPYLEHLRKEHFYQYVLGGALNDAAHGCLLAPWAPILIPAALFGWQSKLQCDWLKRKLQ